MTPDQVVTFMGQRVDVTILPNPGDTTLPFYCVTGVLVGIDQDGDAVLDWEVYVPVARIRTIHAALRPQ